MPPAVRAARPRTTETPATHVETAITTTIASHVSAVFVAVILALYPPVGFGAALAALPVGAAGLLTGFRGGLLAGFLSLPVNTLLLNLSTWTISRT